MSEHETNEQGSCSKCGSPSQAGHMPDCPKNNTQADKSEAVSKFNPRKFFKEGIKTPEDEVAEKIKKGVSREELTAEENAMIKDVEGGFVFKDAIDDPEFAERAAYGVKSLRDRARELVEEAEVLMENDPTKDLEAELITMEARILELQAIRHESRIALRIKKIEEKEKIGMSAEKEERDLKMEIAETYVSGAMSVVGSKFTGLLRKVGIRERPRNVSKR